MGNVFNDDTAVGDDNSDNDDNYDNNLQNSIKDNTDHNSNCNNNVGYEANCTTHNDNGDDTNGDKILKRFRRLIPILNEAKKRSLNFLCNKDDNIHKRS